MWHPTLILFRSVMVKNLCSTDLYGPNVATMAIRSPSWPGEDADQSAASPSHHLSDRVRERTTILRTNKGQTPNL
jgi:hypothetical protein